MLDLLIPLAAKLPPNDKFENTPYEETSHNYLLNFPYVWVRAGSRGTRQR